MKFWEWKKSEKLGIDNETYTNEELRQKFIEEASEVVEAFYYFYDDPKGKNLVDLLQEIMDVIQILLNILRRCRNISKKSGIDYNDKLMKSYINHNEKRLDRGWEIEEKEGIEIGFKTEDVQ